MSIFQAVFTACAAWALLVLLVFVTFEIPSLQRSRAQRLERDAQEASWSTPPSFPCRADTTRDITQAFPAGCP